MVIDGSSVERNDLAIAQFERERIYLPPRFVERAGLSGKQSVDCWLLVVTPGRYRLVREPDASNGGDLSEIHHRIDEVTARGDVLDRTDSNEQAAISARLIPIAASPTGQGWRIHIPKTAMQLIPQSETASFVFVLIVAGYVEFWFPDTLRKAVSAPISQLLP